MVSFFPIAHLLNRMYWKSRRGQFLFLSGATCLSIFMLPKQSAAQQKQMEGKYQKRWDFKTTNLLGSSLVSSFPWKQEFVGICRQRQKSMTPLLLLPSVCVQRSGFQILLPFDKGDIPGHFFSMPFCLPFLY